MPQGEQESRPQATCLTRALRVLTVLLSSMLVAALLAPAPLALAPRHALAEETVAAPADDGASFSSSDLRDDAADPCIIKVGSTYYLFATTSNWGIPYYSSSDLKTWTYAGNALSGSAFAGTGLSRGDVWAPEVRERTVGGRTTYVLTYTAANYFDGSYRICVAEADAIVPGAFGSPKVLDTGSVGNAIDSDLFFDDNGDIWLYFKNEDEYHSICAERLASDWSRISGPDTVLRMDQQWETWTIEGPWMLKWGGTYYLMYSSGGFTTGNYCIGYATSSSPAGPFTKQTIASPLVSTNYGVLGPGHNSTLMVADGEIYLVYHSLHQVGSVDRRLMMDRMGIDSEGRMFVNFAGWGQQPLPSGTMGYYQIPASDYSVTAQGVTSVVLNDVVSGQSDDVAVGTVDASNIVVSVEDGYHVSDLWLFGAGTGLSGTADVVVNGSTVASGYQISGASTKLTLPAVGDYVRSVEVRMSSTQTLSEVLLVSEGLRWGVKSLYRAYNPNSGEHFFTPSAGELAHLVQVGWRDEGVAWTVPDSSNLPVYRLYNPIGGEHHYTLDTGERDYLVSVGWTDEGVGWYAVEGGATPVYRVYNPNMFANNHHFTTDAGERDYLVSIGWHYEGIAWYTE